MYTVQQYMTLQINVFIILFKMLSHTRSNLLGLVRLSPSFSLRLCHDNEGKISTQATICRESLSYVTMRISEMRKWGVVSGETYSLMGGSHDTHNQKDPRSETDCLVWDQLIDCMCWHSLLGFRKPVDHH